MSLPSLNPFYTSQSGRSALSEVLLQVRDQAGVTNWDDFCNVAFREVGLELPVKTLENYAPSPRYSTAPNPGLFYALESWNKARPPDKQFRFANGDLITAIALIDVLLEQRQPTGHAAVSD